LDINDNKDRSMWVITGASGQLGRQIVASVLTRVPAEQVGVSVRDVAKAADLQAQGVRVRRGDYDDRAALEHAFEGATQVVLVSSNGRVLGADPISQHRSAIEAARAAGVRRILYTSHMAASATSAFPPMHDHAATESLLAQSGLAWTSLRNGFYASSVLAMAADGFTRGVLSFPGDGKVSWTAHRDLADATAAILSDEGRFEGPTPPLTASQALDLTDLAGIASSVLGRSVTREVISDDAFQTRMAGYGVPDARLAVMLGLFQASRCGEFAANDSTLEKLLGRVPTSLRALLAQRP
jgi:NAD(P)H dehydrogenase (quinone)